MSETASQKKHVRSVRDHNRALILREIHRRPGLSRTEITERVGLTDAAVSRITREIINLGLIREGGEIDAGRRRGRRHVGLWIETDGPVVLAACLTLFDKSLSLVNLAGEIVSKRDLSEIVALAPEAIPDALARAVMEVTAGPRPVLGLGVVVAGALDHARGFAREGSITSLVGLALRPALERRLEMPVRFENLGNALNLAELEDSAAMGQGNTVMLIHVALGLGTSVVVNGQSLRHDCDERLFGHMAVAGAAELCTCGATGCLNTLVSGLGILARLDGQSPEGDVSTGSAAVALRLLDIVSRANDGDASLTALLADAGRTLGRHLFGALVAAPPQRVILAGPIPQSVAYSEGVRTGLAEAFGRAGASPPPLGVSRFSYRAATAAFAHQEFLFNRPLELERLLPAAT